jgi:ribosome biogenesis protein Tsr3
LELTGFAKEARAVLDPFRWGSAFFKINEYAHTRATAAAAQRTRAANRVGIACVHAARSMR